MNPNDASGGHDRRNHMRAQQQLSAKLSRMGLYSPITGVTENVSKDGAFIKIKEAHALQPHDQIIVTFFLPPDLTGRPKTVGLQGAAIIQRVDHERGGIGLKFITGF